MLRLGPQILVAAQIRRREIRRRPRRLLCRAGFGQCVGLGCGSSFSRGDGCALGSDSGPRLRFIRSRPFQPRARFGKACRIIVRLQGDEEVAALHELIICDMDGLHITLDLGGDLGDVGANVCVVCSDLKAAVDEPVER